MSVAPAFELFFNGGAYRAFLRFVGTRAQGKGATLAAAGRSKVRC
jgi:hypothetical protein